MVLLLHYCILIGTLIHISTCTKDVWEEVPCNSDFKPQNCDFSKIPLLTVEDYDRCGPAEVNRTVRNYYLGAAGRRITYNENKQAYNRFVIVPKILRDVSKSSLEVSTLNQKMSLPIGLAPVAFQTMAHPLGEIATVKAISNMGTVMILSNLASTELEKVAEQAKGGSSHLWMNTYIFKNRKYTIDVVRRAEKAGFKGIVVTVDSPVAGTLTCNARDNVADKVIINLGVKVKEIEIERSATFKDIKWLKSITKLPIIAKGVLSPSDAVEAVQAGASAILVSNHGGRQVDGTPATIDVLKDIVQAVNNGWPRRDVYIDGGIRNGMDVFKAIASGAKMVFVGRPQLWGLAKEGEEGVRNVLNILRKEFEEVMLNSGASNPSKISSDTVVSGQEMLQLRTRRRYSHMETSYKRNRMPLM